MCGLFDITFPVPKASVIDAHILLRFINYPTLGAGPQRPPALRIAGIQRRVILDVCDPQNCLSGHSERQDYRSRQNQLFLASLHLSPLTRSEYRLFQAIRRRFCCCFLPFGLHLQ